MSRIIKKLRFSDSDIVLYCPDTYQSVPLDENNSDYASILKEVLEETTIITSEYIYLLDDFAFDCVDINELTTEIQNKVGITTTLSHIMPYAEKCAIYFEGALILTEKTALDEVVAAHDGR